MLSISPLCLSRLSASSARRFFSSLDSYLLKKDWSGAVSYLESQPSSSPINPDNLDFLMSKLYSSNKPNEAYKLLSLLPSLGKNPSDLDYTLALEVNLNQNKPIQSLSIFYQSHIFGIHLDSATYSSLILSCTKDTGSRNIKWILSCMIRDSAIISLQASVFLIKLAISLEDLGLIESVIKLMHKAKYDFPTKLIKTFLMKNSSASQEYNSLKSLWDNIQQNFYNEPVDDIKTYDINIKILNNDYRISPSFELVILNKSTQKQLQDINLDPNEGTSSD